MSEDKGGISLNITTISTSLVLIGITGLFGFMLREIHNLKEWQRLWPQTGLLQADVDQNAKIRSTEEDIEKLEEMVVKLQDSVFNMQMDMVERGMGK